MNKEYKNIERAARNLVNKVKAVKEAKAYADENPSNFRAMLELNYYKVQVVNATNKLNREKMAILESVL